MIEVTVKTLDAKNHVFTVSEELTVKEFKDEISPTVTIPAVEQRLIFRGRVLQDEKKISEYNVANNTIHLVQRPTQSSGGTQNDEPPRNTGSADDRFNLEGGGGGIIITAVSEQSVNATGLRRNSAALRLQNGTEMVNKASSLLQKLEEDDEVARVTSQAENASATESSNMETEHSQSHAPDAGSMELDPDDPASFGRMISQVANAASHAAVLSSVRAFQNSANIGTTGSGQSAQTEGEQSSQVSGNNSQNSSGNPSNNNLNATRRAEAPRLRDMAIALQDLLAFHERLTPFLNFVQNILRENRLHSSDTGELRSVQYTFDTISEVLHYLGHSYHSYSDLMCDFATAPENRRISAPATILVEQSTVVRATIPIAVPTFAAQPNMGQQPTAQQQPTSPHGSTGNAASHNVPNAPTGQLPTFPGMNQTPPPGVNSFHSHGGPGFSINIQSNGMPDLAAILGPALAGAGGGAGMLPFLSLGGLQANLRQQQAQQQNTQSQPQQLTQNQSNSTGQNTASNTTSGSTQATPRSSQPNSNPTGGTTQNPNPMGHLRTEHMPPSFDVLLSCHSHHANRAVQNRRRPDDLQTHISSVRSNSGVASSDSNSSVDIIEGLIDLSVTDTISTKDEKIAYQQTFSELVTMFYFKFLSLIVSSGPNRQFRTSALLLWEEYMSKLFAVFRLCFPNNKRVPEILAKALVEEFLAGMPLVFRSYTHFRLAEYFAFFSAQADSTNMPAEAAGVIFISEEKVRNDETLSTGASVEPSSSVSYNALLAMAERLTAVPPQNSSPSPAASAVAAAAEIPKPIKTTTVPVVDEAMDTDIDNLLDHIPAPFSPEETRLDGPLTNIPSEWRDTVRHDIRRQLGMMDQPPPSPGFCALFPRKN
ncbi:unnamed protein product [Allacma fusca]|uniref:Ubiquitin-like domain-containing protein n=1 Tax=Allacma fusca TaxID=39272 RepID=A0A8J2JVC5_9HEXA|nr:unnamed protein product [Allacma fusca]